MTVKISLNEEIQNRTIRHAVYLEGFKASEIKRLRKILNEQILPGITAQLQKRLLKIQERGTDLGPDTTDRLKQLEKELTKLAQDMTATLKDHVTADTKDLAAHEMDWQNQTINHSIGFDLDLVIPNPRSVARIIKATSFSGLNLDQWFDTIKRSTQKNIMMTVNRGMVEGKTTDQIIRDIRGTKKLNYTDGVYESTRRQAETVTRTLINHTANQARIEFFKENSDIISGLKWVSVLDSRTSIICAGLDGKVYDVDKGPRPPAHPNCRSTMTAVLKGAKALGLNDLPGNTRASIDGQIPASTTYSKWLKGQSVSVQEDVLGVSKAALFRDGKLPLDRFTDANLQPLTLDQLRETENTAFTKAGL